MNFLTKWFKRAEKPKPLLLGVSKPGIYTVTSFSRHGDPKGVKKEVLVELYMLGTDRFWLIDGEKSGVSFPRMDFWAKTGEFHDPTDTDAFVWMVSPREQKEKASG